MMCPRSSMFLAGEDLLSTGALDVGTNVWQVASISS